MGRISVLTLRTHDDDESSSVFYFDNEQDCIAAFAKIADQAKEFPVVIATEKESSHMSIYNVLTRTSAVSFHEIGQIIIEHYHSTDDADIGDKTFEVCFGNLL